MRLDKDGIPQYDESQLIRQEDQEGNETEFSGHIPPSGNWSLTVR